MNEYLCKIFVLLIMVTVVIIDEKTTENMSGKLRSLIPDPSITDEFIKSVIDNLATQGFIEPNHYRKELWTLTSKGRYFLDHDAFLHLIKDAVHGGGFNNGVYYTWEA